MCSTTGTGEAKNRALSGVIGAPEVSWAIRKAPARTGTAQSTISAAGARHWRLVEVWIVMS